MTGITLEKNDKLFYFGLIALSISSLLLCLPFLLPTVDEPYSGLFLANYFITVVYFICITLSGRLRKGRKGLVLVFVFLTLSFLSAYSLNREMNVFDQPTTWFVVLQIIICLNFLLFAFYDRLAKPMQKAMLVIAGIAMLVFVYLSIYLFPMFPLGIIGMIALGISFHVFVPALFVLYILKLVRRVANQDFKAWRYFLFGITTGIVFLGIYVFNWHTITKQINETAKVKSIQAQEGLPAWVEVARKLPKTQFAERILKTDIVYLIPEQGFNKRIWRIPTGRWNDEISIHDPLMVIAAVLVGRPNISFEEKAKVLETVFDARHQSEERLWEGSNLTTDQVDTKVEIWPQYSVSYTEKKIVVTNNHKLETWTNNSQEGIYTFSLPEGAVVSSLSLWINGKEEKGILTSKEKATTAYNQIVGVQRRDPSVVHWKEGNRVSVRVFPVIAKESRMFKIGITAPLERERGKMIYRNIQFKGPDFSKAKENVEILNQAKSNNLVVPAVFEKTSGSVRTDEKYQADWMISMNKQPISPQTFSFDGNSYRVRPYIVQRQAASFNKVYLDINSNWTNSDFERIWPLLKGKSIWVYDNDLIELNNKNYLRIFNKLQTSRFSLFPFHKIDNANNSLVVTKNADYSPNLEDLQGSGFLALLKNETAKSGSTYCVFNIGQTLTPYLKTLKEYRIFRYETGTIELLSELIKTQQFARNIESDQQVILENSGLAINVEPRNSITEAPDHLMRLFAYNHILQQQGRSMFSDSAWNELLVKEAQKANIVTPVSSLIVLETQADYDRFKISNDEISLKNASAKGTGAAPEPHEWALILIGAIIIARLKFPFLFQRVQA